MSGAAEHLDFTRREEPVRWAASLLLVLGLHTAAGLALLDRRLPEIGALAPSEAIMLDLAPEPVAPAAEPDAEPAPPEPLREELLPSPPSEPVAESPSVEEPPQPPPPEPPPEVPAVPPEVALPPPPPATVRRPAPPRTAARPSPPRPAESTAPAPPAAAPAAPPPSDAVPSWQGRLLGRLQRFKQYPESARFRREEGVAHVTFTMDRDGRVLAAGIARSSGSAALDAETLALVRRAEPMPTPPAEMPGNTITLTVPLRFSLH